MTIGLDRAAPARQRDDPLPELTPDQARQLAAVLAQHMMAMRAVTAGTQYGEQAGSGPEPLSPATEIFIAGTLELICAGEQLMSAGEQESPADGACERCEQDDITLSARAVLAGGSRALAG
jgi:hypothetical protein